MTAIGYVIFDKTAGKYLLALMLGRPVWTEDFHHARRYEKRELAIQVRDYVTSNDNGELVVWPVCGICGQPGECKPVIGIPIRQNEHEGETK